MFRSHTKTIIGLFALCAIFQSSPVLANDSIPSITAAAVQDTSTAEFVRIVTSTPIEKLEHKIICSGDMIRIRLGNIIPRTNKIEQLEIPDIGPLGRVRIVPKGKTSTVLQLYPWRDSIGTCARTSVMLMKGEIIVSTAFSQSDISRREKQLSANDHVKSTLLKSQLQNNAEANDEEANDEEANNEDETIESEEDSETKIEDKKASTPLKFAKNLKTKSDTASTDRPVSEATSSPILNSPRAAAAFGFAALIAAVAWWFTKKKKNPLASEDTIDIICSKRLGAKQQLVLACVQDTRFLLAVSDKSVTTLGMLPNQGDQDFSGILDTTPNVSPPKPQKIRSNKVSPDVFAAQLDPRETIKSMLEAQVAISRQEEINAAVAAAAAAVPAAPAPAPVEEIAPIDELAKAFEQAHASTQTQQFENELEQALSKNMNRSRYQDSSQNPSSNVAGLIAMARMKAGLKQRSNKPRDISPEA